jgi:hypothetical protein
MSKWQTAFVILLSFLCPHSSWACSCSNSIPIQGTSDRYRERAVFTAHVMQLMGRIYNFEGKRMSGQVLAVVRERYWGLPWYWPKVVLLDGGFFCNIAMAEGEDYLVSGRRTRYGMIDVSVCSRTQPLESAQIDLRTLDGSHCSRPGGTVIGRVTQGWDPFRATNPFVRNVSLTFRNQDGGEFSAQSDGDGIYELQHLPAGTYTLDSHFNQAQYASSSDAPVAEGVCGERDILVRNYDFSGRVPAGLKQKVTVKLVRVDGQPEEIRSDSIEPDGRFYFGNVPDGDYLLVLTSWIAGATDNFYYPGTGYRQKAAQIRIINHRLAKPEELDFNADTLPLVAVLVGLDPPANSGRYKWEVDLINSDYVNDSEPWRAGEKVVRVYGRRGGSYKVQLFGYSNQPTVYDNCVSETVTVQPGPRVVHLTVPTSCR